MDARTVPKSERSGKQSCRGVMGIYYRNSTLQSGEKLVSEGPEEVGRVIEEALTKVLG